MNANDSLAAPALDLDRLGNEACEQAAAVAAAIFFCTRSGGAVYPGTLGARGCILHGGLLHSRATGLRAAPRSAVLSK